jgi:hypothetical protein
VVCAKDSNGCFYEVSSTVCTTSCAAGSCVSTPEAGADAGADAGDAAATCGTHDYQACGDAGLCDLTTHDCCGNLTEFCTTTCGESVCSTNTACVAKHSDGGSSCPTSGTEPASVACASACDCPSGQVCCASTTGAYSASASCTVAENGYCPGADAGTGKQLCVASSECGAGQDCISQTCITEVFGISLCGTLSACGLPSGCTAN